MSFLKALDKSYCERYSNNTGFLYAAYFLLVVGKLRFYTNVGILLHSNESVFIQSEF